MRVCCRGRRWRAPVLARATLTCVCACVFECFSTYVLRFPFFLIQFFSTQSPYALPRSFFINQPIQLLYQPFPLYLFPPGLLSLLGLRFQDFFCLLSFLLYPFPVILLPTSPFQVIFQAFPVAFLLSSCFFLSSSSQSFPDLSLTLLFPQLIPGIP